jgi:membrane protein DedA with SNARE-associated domain
VLLEQLGLQIPALPTLVVAGALAAAGKLAVTELFLVAVVACVIADGAWYAAGRTYGSRVMKTLCRVSLTSDSCVSETQSRFERWGVNARLLAKFVPGLATIAPPLAGATLIPLPRFLWFNTIGGALWVVAVIVISLALYVAYK